jgi:hypothetical protein
MPSPTRLVKQTGSFKADLLADPFLDHVFLPAWLASKQGYSQVSYNVIVSPADPVLPPEISYSNSIGLYGVIR